MLGCRHNLLHPFGAQSLSILYRGGVVGFRVEGSGWNWPPQLARSHRMRIPINDVDVSPQLVIDRVGALGLGFTV